MEKKLTPSCTDPLHVKKKNSKKKLQGKESKIKIVKGRWMYGRQTSREEGEAGNKVGKGSSRGKGKKRKM